MGMPGLRNDPPVIGNAKVRDADTLVIGEEVFRLSGVDALEFTQICTRNGADWPCGREATRALDGYLRGRTVSCAPEATDRYGRTVARCTLEDGSDIGEWLARNGWAFDSSRFGDGPYIDAQDEAERAARGAFAGTFDQPAEWRRMHRMEED